MKLRVLNMIACLFIAACTITSCLDDENITYETNYNASITSFSIKDSIITYYPSVTEAGKDTMLSKAVVGSKYPFVIDQNKGLIYNADSLPVGTDISKVVVNILADGYYIAIEAGENDSLWIETDSLDFTNPIQFKVLSEMNIFGQTYTAKINVQQQDPDILAWHKLESNLSTEIQSQKAVYLNNKIYVFAEQDSQIAVTSSSNGKEWTTLQAIDITDKASYSSAMAWNGNLYILANKVLYTSTNGINWTKVETEQTFSHLFANSKNKMIGADSENHYIESTDGIHWERYGSLPQNFPQSPYTFATYSLSTNSNLKRIVMMGYNPAEEDTTNVVWSQIDNEHEWAEMTYDNNQHLCPKFTNPTIIHYDEKLYAFGGPVVRTESIDAFTQFYTSKDNGISWEPVKKNLSFPEEFKTLYEASEGNYSCILDKNNFIWIIWSKTGEVWRGRINRLGFIKE